jgi:hypothetical protein
MLSGTSFSLPERAPGKTLLVRRSWQGTGTPRGRVSLTLGSPGMTSSIEGDRVAGPLKRAGSTALERIVTAYSDFVAPRPNGLPNWRVVTWFPLLIILGGTVLIALTISGTSSGAHWTVFGTGIDPRVILGGPRPIRSDEWLVQQSWIASQAAQGFPVINHTFPGGMNSTIIFELPNWDWSSFFRPHMWGFLFFGLDVGVAWQWWVPAMGLVSGTYLLVVTLLPRRAITAAVIACAVFFTPIFQWWYGPNALWPAAWSLLAMAGTIWVLRDSRLWVRVVWSAVLGWLAVTMAIGLYVPFIVPSVLVFVFFFLGSVLNERPWKRGTLKPLLRQLSPLIIAGVAAGAVLVVWVLTRLPAFTSEGKTVYPGARSDLTGRLLAEDPSLTGIGGAPFGQSFLTAGTPTPLGPNPSEAATAILLALFLAPALLWLTVRARRRTGRLDWLLVASLGGLLVGLAYLLLPGWDAVAHLLLLDKVPVSRFRMGFAVMLPLFFALVVREIDRSPLGRRWPLAAISALLATGLTLFVLAQLLILDEQVLIYVRLWPIAAVAIVAACVLIFYRRSVPVAAALLLVASLVIGAVVNPLYTGVFQLNQTKIGKEVISVNRAERGTWVGVGDWESMAVLMSSGVEAYSGVQPYPSLKMWKAIDPTGKYEFEWNRLAHVRWTFGTGEPVSTNPERDIVLSTFDACSVFAQKHVDYVLADEKPKRLDCLDRIDNVSQGKSRMQVYRVVSPQS